MTNDQWRRKSESRNPKELGYRFKGVRPFPSRSSFRPDEGIEPFQHRYEFEFFCSRGRAQSTKQVRVRILGCCERSAATVVWCLPAWVQDPALVPVALYAGGVGRPVRIGGGECAGAGHR